jgi:uncharacterized membrane protein YbhN (UPF0104 family)
VGEKGGALVRIGSWLRIGVSSAVVVFILWRVPLLTLASALNELNSRWLWAALASVLAMLTVRCYRWHLMLRAGGVPLGRSESVKSLLAGFTLSAVTPGRIGELGRCLFVPDAHRAPVLLLNILDRALDMWALATFSVASLMVLAPRPYGVFALGVWLALLPVALGLPNLIADLGGLPWWGQAFREKLRAARQTVLNIPTAPFAAWAVTSTALDMLTFSFLLRAFHPSSLLPAVVTFPWIVIAAGLPISVSGFGPREGVATLLLARYAIPSATACDVGLLMFAFSGLLPAFIGGIWLATTAQHGHPRWSENLEALVERT